jgi:hypothetical protein
MKNFIFLALTVSLFFSSCDTIKNLPTNTSGGFFSLNGTWTLSSASDNALTGSTITVYPITGSATVNTLSNNSNCIREKDAIWKDIKNTSSGSFSVNALVSNCNNSIVYKAATLTVLTADEVRLTGQTVSGAELSQTWTRVKK